MTGFKVSSAVSLEFRLTAAVLGTLEAQLGVLVEAHPPQLCHIFGRGGNESEAVTASSRGNLPQKKKKSSGRAQQSGLIHKSVFSWTNPNMNIGKTNEVGRIFLGAGALLVLLASEEVKSTEFYKKKVQIRKKV